MDPAADPVITEVEHEEPPAEEHEEPAAEEEADALESTTEEVLSSLEAFSVKDAEQAKEAKARGNQCYKDGDYPAAVDAYTEAIEMCPTEETEHQAALSIYYSNRSAVHFMLEQWEYAVADCSSALKANERNIKALLRRAKVYEKLDKVSEALKDMNGVLEVEPNHPEARPASIRLAAEEKVRLEKMKDEMMGKLKDVGNTILGKFGMSLDNFKAVQDPNTGSYSINFGQ